MVTSSPAIPLPPRGPVAEHAGPLLAAVPCDQDASGSEGAQVVLAKGKLVLALCGHHFRASELDLAAAGWRITHDSRIAGW
jgi:hypothetical protein